LIDKIACTKKVLILLLLGLSTQSTGKQAGKQAGSSKQRKLAVSCQQNYQEIKFELKTLSGFSLSFM